MNKVTKVKTATKQCYTQQEVREFLDEMAENGYDLRRDILGITFDPRFNEHRIFYISKETS